MSNTCGLMTISKLDFSGTQNSTRPAGEADRANRSGIGVGAPQFGQRRGLYGGLTLAF